TSIGFLDLDTTSCGQSIYNSQNPALVGGDVNTNSPTIRCIVVTRNMIRTATWFAKNFSHQGV
ncbi:MAG: hypothetical protein P8Y40_08375, partial [Desulfobacterales bacterium]